MSPSVFEHWRRGDLHRYDFTPVMAVCPKCGAEVEDMDGFGVLDHEACGYCSHPDAYGGICQVCGLGVSVSGGKETQR